MNSLLGEIRTNLKEHIDYHRVKWTEFGCVLMLDRGMTQNKFIINFLVYCHGKTIFIYFFYFEGEKDDYKLIKGYLMCVIVEVKIENAI